MRESAKPIYEFGLFRLDATGFRLLEQGEPVPLAPKEFDLLLVLVERRGQVVSKDDLLKTVWPDTIVEETNLTVIISALRKALGESAERKYIETIPKRGYRFVAPVREIGHEGRALVVAEQTRSRVVIEEEVKTEDRESRIEDRRLNAVRSSILHPRSSSRFPLRSSILGLVVLVGLAAALAYFWMRSPSPPTEPLATVKSIAVLPFKPLSADESDDYLGLGMADTLITKLSNLRQLIVRPTSAVRKYASPEQDPLAAGREQRVDAVLEGSIQRAGERVRVTVRLLSVADGKPLWAYQSDEQHADLFAMQDAISEQVAERLAVKLTGEQRAALAKRYTENVEAYQLYLKGLYHFTRRTPQAFGPPTTMGFNIRKSIEYFQRAIEIDPNYALAYSGLSGSYATLPVTSDVPSGEAGPKAKEAAMKALELDDALAEAHLSLGVVKFWIEWDWPGVQRECQRAIELNPNHALAHFRYAHYLSNMGRHAEAIAEANRAVELDPVSPMTSLFLGQFLYQARQYDQAIGPLQNALEIAPNDWIAHLNLGKVYVQQKKYGEAIAEFQKARQLSGGTIATVSVIGHALAVSGQRGEAHKLLDELKRMSKQRYVPPYGIAAVYAGLGEKEQVLDWLEKAYQERDVRLIFLKVEPKWDDLRAEPRFNDLLRRIGLAP